MTIAAFDLGNHTGIAINSGDTVSIETKKWSTDAEDRVSRGSRMDRRRDPRVVRFFEYVRDCPAQLLVFEDVLFVKSRIQAHLWASYRTALWLGAGNRMIECVATGVLKKFASGNGGATKEQMETALKRKHPTRWTMGLDDNAIDAIWLWIWAQQNLSRTPLDKVNLPK